VPATASSLAPRSAPAWALTAALPGRQGGRGRRAAGGAPAAARAPQRRLRLGRHHQGGGPAEWDRQRARRRGRQRQRQQHAEHAVHVVLLLCAPSRGPCPGSNRDAKPVTGMSTFRRICGQCQQHYLEVHVVFCLALVDERLIQGRTRLGPCQ